MQIDQQAIIAGVLAILSAIVWFIRGEGRVTYLEKRIDELEKHIDVLQAKHDSLDSKIVDELGKLRECTARIEGYLNAKKEED